jgi:peptide/nickel transport system ATP-binding protein/oligopeptide transport system ATP-binding protein
MHTGRGGPVGIIDVAGLSKHFAVKKVAGKKQTLRAVDGVTFSVKEGSVFSIVGESGCGKSTVARLVVRLIAPTEGNIFFEGKDIRELRGTGLREFRESVQIIFQDPFASLNPRMTIFDAVSEPLRIHKIAPKAELKERVVKLITSVGLQPDILDRYPHEFSGGQRQRICIARALAVSPAVIVADEPLSALDVSIQAQILNILRELRERQRISFLFISHDLRVVRYFSDEIAVMYLGKIVEHAESEALFSNPLHPYTVVLLSSAPKLRPDGTGRIVLKGDVPSPIDIPPGCPFHPRCPKRFEPCDRIVPRLEEPTAKGSSGRLVSCHLWNPY